ncbi:MAG: hypothetical protein GX276_02305 [Clostridiaceae bacterium]|nr:transposase [Acidobacteriota bacterium]NLK88962.1 hypothetical protein [Clostridiaceae bacterium]NLN91674.1 hypothetical protein [candidate division WS1 bacterium]NLT32732.1 hypothetical protein [Acidobacteriota bacterium]HHX93458.1 hypothetical protein [Clostridiales bacterium]
MTQSTTRPVLFGACFPRLVTVAFDRQDSNSDGGAVLLKVADKNLGLTECLEKTIRDSRQPGKVLQRNPDLLRQRIFSIAAGYPDCNDADSLAKGQSSIIAEFSRALVKFLTSLRIFCRVCRVICSFVN